MAPETTIRQLVAPAAKEANNTFVTLYFVRLCIVGLLPLLCDLWSRFGSPAFAVMCVACIAAVAAGAKSDEVVGMHLKDDTEAIRGY